MTKRIFLLLFVFLILILALVGTTLNVLAYGQDLSFPAARLSLITQGYHSTHKAYDYRTTRHTKIAAARNGSVSASSWILADDTIICNDSILARGNYIFLDHGNDTITRYYHLSNTGKTPGIGKYFHRGAYMALSDNTGCSSADHLHFALWKNGSPRDPYAGNTHWVSGAPIPMGYRNQSGSTKGPYALDNSKIRNKWNNLEGSPGAPVENNRGISCAGVPGQEQRFERGYINYCGSGSAEYTKYGINYLPKISLDESDSGWNSNLYLRNDSAYTTNVSLIVYNQDGTVKDSRTNIELNPRAGWGVDLRDIIFDYLIDYDPPYNEIFSGSAGVYSNQNVSVVALNKQGSPVLAHSYTGVSNAGSGAISTDTDISLPILYSHSSWGYYSRINVQNAWSSNANVNINFFDRYGNSKHTSTYYNLSPNSVWKIDMQNDSPYKNWTDFYGTALITSSKPVAGVVDSINPEADIDMDYNAVNGDPTEFFLPYLMKNYYDWDSCFVVQNINSYPITYYITYYPYGTPWNPYLGEPITRGPLSLNGRATHTECQESISELPDGRTAGYVYSYSPVAVAANQSTPSQVMSYTGFTMPSDLVILPYMVKSYVSNGTWNGGIQVQNVSESLSTTDIAATFYDMNGNLVGSPHYWYNVEAMDSVTLYLPDKSDLPNGFIGSAVLISLESIVAVGNASCNSGCNGDTSFTYNGINR